MMKDEQEIKKQLEINQHSLGHYTMYRKACPSYNFYIKTQMGCHVG